MENLHLKRPTLLGRVVHLEPLGEHHAAELAALAQASPEIFRYTFRTVPKLLNEAGYAAHIAALNSRADWCAFAVRRRDSGALVGSTSYLEIRPEHKGLEIGSTWLSPAQQGTQVNPEMKYLMLWHAFEQLSALRVQLKTHHANTHSQRAIEKLGALREGLLRNHVVMPDGSIRHTVMYSVIVDEWPACQARLVARLGYDPADNAAILQRG